MSFPFSVLFVVVISIQTTLTQSALSWTVPKSPLFSSARSAMCVGYFNESIWIIGGYMSGRDVVEYSTTDDEYTEYEYVVNSVTADSAQQYTQIEHMIYIFNFYNYGDYIVSYDMRSKTYTPDVGFKQDTDLYVPCLTHIGTDHLIVLGGRGTNGPPTTDVHIFHISQSAWIDNGPSMITPRAYHSCNVNNNALWAIGGYDNGIHLDSVEVLEVPDINDINNNAWYILSDVLSVAREKLRSVVHSDMIYVIGGYMFTGGIELDEAQYNVDVIDTSTHTITSDTHLPIAVWDAAPIVAPNINTLFVFGGMNQSLGSVHRLDTMQKTLLPTDAPTSAPSTSPTNPTLSPSVLPTLTPTLYPTNTPTLESLAPTMTPSSSPTQSSEMPSLSPTLFPSVFPTLTPTSYPTNIPSSTPSKMPSISPTLFPSVFPTLTPTSYPTNVPSSAPSQYSTLYFICHYNDDPMTEYVQFMTLVHYADIMRNVTLQSIEAVAHEAITWENFGILFCVICNVFNTKINDECLNYASNDDIESEYIAIGRFGVVEDDTIDQYKDTIADIMTSDELKTIFTENMNIELGAIHSMKRRNLLDEYNSFEAIKFKVIDSDNYIQTTYDGQSDPKTSVSESETAMIIVLVLFILIAITIISGYIYYKKSKNIAECHDHEKEGKHNGEQEIEVGEMGNNHADISLIHATDADDGNNEGNMQDNDIVNVVNETYISEGKNDLDVVDVVNQTNIEMNPFLIQNENAAVFQM